MDSKQSWLTVILAPSAINELDAIWHWNAQTYGAEHADTYIKFLMQSINNLGSPALRGLPVSGRPDVRSLSIRRRSKGHGHVVVFRVKDSAVQVLHVFHTSQDWQNKLDEDK